MEAFFQLLFQGAKFSEAKNSEYENLDLFLSRLESWTHKLYPKWPRETTLQKIEMLGKKKVVRNTLGTGSKSKFYFHSRNNHYSYKVIFSLNIYKP